MDVSLEHVFREAKRLAAVAGALGTTSLVLYVVILLNEGDNPTLQVATWATGMTVPTGLALFSLTQHPAAARWTLSVATVLFMPFVILFSLGIGFLVAGVLTGTAAIKLHVALHERSQAEQSASSHG